MITAFLCTVSAPDGTQQAFVGTLLLWAAFLVLSEFLKPKPNVENARRARLSDFQFPTATEGRPVPLLWGTCKLDAPNVIWYGDLRQRPIQETIRTGLFSKTKVTTGYAYFLGVQMAFCRGGTDAVNSLRRIWVGEKELWSGEVDGDGEELEIFAPGFLGGTEQGNGGLAGTLVFYKGTYTQTPSTYIQQHQVIGGQTPAYRGTCLIELQTFYLGNSTNIEPWAVELRRIPNGLDLADPSVNDGNDANPMNVIFELLTNTEWGLGFPEADIDTTNFATAAATLRTEGNGISLVVDSAIEAQQLLREIERQIDGVVYIDPDTGLYKVQLARGGYDLEDLPSIDSTNLIELKSYARSAWNATTNDILVSFTNRTLEYKETFARAQDMANVRTQGNRVVSATQNYPGVKDPALANQIAWRELRTLSAPLARAEVTVDRTFYNAFPGQPVKLSSTELGITDLAMRIISVDLGELTNGKVQLVLVEDIFVFDEGVFAAPGGTEWTLPPETVVEIPVSDSQVFEAPRAFITRDPEIPNTPNRIWGGGRYQGDAAAEIKFLSRPNTGSYTEAGDAANFLLAGELAANLAASGNQGSITVTLDPVDTPTEMLNAMVAAATTDDCGFGLVNLVKINNEFFLFRSVAVSSGQLVLSSGYRGVLDSARAAHAANDRAWILLGNLTDRVFSTGTTQNIKLIPVSPSDELAELDATAIDVVMSDRYRKPYPPTNFTANSAAYPTGSVSLDNGSGLDARGVTVGFVRRDFRTADEARAVLNESGLPSDFPTANTTEYAVEVRNDPDGANTLLYTTDWSSAASILLSRTRILRNTAGVVPTRLRASVKTRHTVDGDTLEALQNLSHDFNVASALLSGDFNFGVLGDLTGSAVFSAPSTGTYTLNLGTALTGGTVQYRLNGGSWTDILTAGETSDTFSATAGDDIEVRHSGGTSSVSESFLELVFSSNSVAYAILTF